LLPLIEAIVADDRDAVSRMLRDQPGLANVAISEEVFVAPIVHQLYVGDTALHVAAAGFRQDMIAPLLAAGADVTARNRRGAQPLHYACDTNRHAPDAQAATITVLLKVGADPNARDKSGTAPLHRAVRTRGSAAVGALLEGGADPNLRNGNGSTPMRLAQQTTGRGGTGTTEAKAEQATIIRLLLQAGARSEP
jgi:ankyrin repeat protein